MLSTLRKTIALTLALCIVGGCTSLPSGDPEQRERTVRKRLLTAGAIVAVTALVVATARSNSKGAIRDAIPQ